MATKSAVCPECGEPVPYGRLSCAGCGALLASVPGGQRRESARSRREAAARAAGSDGDGGGGVSVATTADPGPAQPGSDVDAIPTPSPARRTRARKAAPRVVPDSPVWERPVGASVDDRNGGPATFDPVVAGLVPTDDDVSAPASGWALHAPAEPAAGAAISVPTYLPDDLLGDLAREPAGAPLPPSAIFTTSAAGKVQGIPGGALGRLGRRTRRRAGTDGQPEAGQVSLLADLPFDAPETLPAWLVASGAAVTMAGFLLPWSETVIGASGIGSYFDSWGLGSPTHFFVFLGSIGTLTLAVLPNRLPDWLRTGVVGLFLGGLVLGLVWPYLIGGFGWQIGVLAEAIGGALLAAGGILAQRRPRHVEDDPAV